MNLEHVFLIWLKPIAEMIGLPPDESGGNSKKSNEIADIFRLALNQYGGNSKKRLMKLQMFFRLALNKSGGNSKKIVMKLQIFSDWL